MSTVGLHQNDCLARQVNLEELEPEDLSARTEALARQQVPFLRISA